MKQFLPLVILLLLIIPLYAQEKTTNSSIAKIADCAVYFSLGKASLDDENTAIIYTLLDDYNKELLTEIRIQAFTDDQGTTSQNQKIARERANSIRQFLVEEGVDLSQIIELPFQQLKRNSNNNIEKQRKEFRRVTIELWQGERIKNPLTAFFDAKREAAKQYFSFDASQGTEVIGAEGTRLQIAPNSFVTADGTTATGKVEFVLQEAYSYSSMLLQNLPTMAGDKLLETGGMLYVEARDAAGRQLKLKEGQQIQAVMASEEASLPDMQTFEGEKKADGTVNWVATNQAVLRGSPASIDTTTIVDSIVNMDDAKGLAYDYIVSRTLVVRTPIEEYMAILDQIPSFNRKLPKQVDKPRFKLKKPKVPKLRVAQKPNKDALGARYAQYSNESTRNYRKRINVLYQKANKRYQKDNKYNTEKTKDYEQRLSEYEQTLKQYNKDKQSYDDYNDTMRVVLKELQLLTDSFDIEKVSKAFFRLNAFFVHAGGAHQEVKMLLSAMERMGTYYEEQGHDFSKVNERMGTLTAGLLSKRACRQLYGLKSVYRVKGIYRWCRLHQYKDHKKLSKKINYISTRIPKEGNMKPYQLQRITQYYNDFKENYNFKRLIQYREKVKRSFEKQHVLIQQYLEQQEAIEMLQQAFWAKERALKLPNQSIIVAARNFTQNRWDIQLEGKKDDALGWNCNYDEQYFNGQVTQVLDKGSWKHALSKDSVNQAQAKQVLDELYEKTSEKYQKDLITCVHGLSNYFSKVVRDYTFLDKELKGKKIEIQALELDNVAIKNLLTRMEEADLSFSNKELAQIRVAFKIGDFSLDQCSRKSRVKVQTLYTQLSKKASLSANDLQKIRVLKSRIEEEDFYKILGRYIQKISKNYKLHQQLMVKFIGYYKGIERLREDYKSIKQDLGLLSPSEVATVYGNALGITTMGWINCDRFRNVPLMNLKILADVNENTVFFVVFDDLRAVLRARKYNNSWIANVPKNRHATVIGLSVHGQEADVFIRKGKMGELQEIEATFQKYSLKEAEQFLEAI